MLVPKRLSLIIRLALGVSLGILLLWWLLRDINAQELIRHLLDFSWERLAPVMGLVLVGGVVRAYRWRLLFHENPPSVSRLFFVENTGIGANSVAPVRVLAEPIQFSYLAIRDGYDRGTVLASLVLGRVMDLMVTLTTIAIGLSLFPPSQPLRQAVWVATIIGISVALGVALLSLSLHRWSWPRRWPLLATYGTAWHELVAQPRRLAWVVAVTSAQWALLGLGAWIVARDVDIALSFPVIYIVTLGIMTLGFTLPGLPSGLGPFEFAAVLLLALYGVPREPALAFGLIIHGAFLLPPIVIAVTTLVVHGPPWSVWRAAKRRRSVAATTRRQVGPRSGGGGEEQR